MTPREGRTANKSWARCCLPTLILWAFIPCSVLAQDEAATSIEQGSTPMSQSVMGSPHQTPSPIDAPDIPESASPFIRDARLSAQLRSYYMDRTTFDDSKNEAWALGGSVSFKSGYLANLLGIGAVVYTSQPVYAPDDRDGTLLLLPGQDGYTVLGQIYGEIKFTDQLFGALGRKEYSTPFINKNDSRMSPNTFEGASVYGKAGGREGEAEWRFGGGYLSKIKERNSDEFVWMSRDAGATVDRGVYLAGINFEQAGFSIGAINYYSDDIINIFYTEASYGLSLAGGDQLKLAAQFADQQSTGEDLLTGQSFSTRQWGIKADLNLGAALLTLACTQTAEAAAMQNPWGGYPGYSSVQVESFNRAGESAVLLRAAYDFSSLGAEGLSAYALWVNGNGVAAPLYNEDEVDLNLQWTPRGGALRGTSFRLRYALVKQEGGGDPTLNDFRFIVNYDFPRP